jgi:hypothetical protein
VSDAASGQLSKAPAPEEQKGHAGYTEVPENQEKNKAEAPIQGRPSVREAPAPENPNLAAEIATLKQQLGNAVSKLGSLERERDAARREAEIARELETLQRSQPSAGMQNNPHSAQRQQTALPSDIDPSDTLTFGTFAQVLGNYHQLVQAEVGQQQANYIRTNWDVTSEEETAAVSRYPALQNAAEPGRTAQIQKIVRQVIRPEREGNGQTQADGARSTPAQSTRATPPNATAETVPLTEAPVSVAGEPRQGNRAEALMTEYESVKKRISNSAGPERKRLLKELQALNEEIMAAQGMSYNELFNYSFTQD